MSAPTRTNVSVNGQPECINLPSTTNTSQGSCPSFTTYIRPIHAASNPLTTTTSAQAHPTHSRFFHPPSAPTPHIDQLNSPHIDAAPQSTLSLGHLSLTEVNLLAHDTQINLFLADPSYMARLRQERLDAMRKAAQSLGLDLPDWMIERMAYRH